MSRMSQFEKSKGSAKNIVFGKREPEEAMMPKKVSGEAKGQFEEKGAEKRVETKGFQSIGSLKSDLLSPPTQKGKPLEDSPRDIEIQPMPGNFVLKESQLPDRPKPSVNPADLDAVLLFLVLTVNRQQAFINQLLSGQPITKASSFTQFGATTLDQTNFMNKLKAVIAADVAQPTQNFKNFNRVAANLNILSIKDVQALYENRAPSLTATTKLDIPLGESTVISQKPNEPIKQESSPKPPATETKKSEQQRDVSGETLIAWESLLRLSNQLKNREISESEFIGFQKLVYEIGNFHRSFQSAIETSRDRLLIISPPEYLKLEFEPDLLNFQKSLDQIKSRNAEYERFAYAKLADLRSQNNQLQIVQTHISK